MARKRSRLASAAKAKSLGAEVIGGGQRRQNTVRDSEREGGLFTRVRRADGRVGHRYDEGENPYTVWLPLDKDRVRPERAAGASRERLERQAAPARTDPGSFRDVTDRQGSPSSLIELIRQLRLPQARKF